MQISISSIKDRHGAALPFEFSIPPDSLTELPTDVRAVSDLEVRGEVTNTGESMLVRADVRGRFAMTCSRCLQTAETVVDMTVRERFRREEEPRDESEEAELDEEEADVSYYRGERIDLGEVVREHVALQLPMKPVCREDCRGLCPQCGANWNEEKCDCRQDDVDPRLAVLKSLLADQSPSE